LLKEIAKIPTREIKLTPNTLATEYKKTSDINIFLLNLNKYTLNPQKIKLLIFTEIVL